jgi:2-isopropylmalate synthase
VHDQRHRRARRQRVARRDRHGHARARRSLPVDTDIVTTQLYACSQLLTEITGEAVQSNKAIVGRNAFAHEAGIHQDGMLKDRRTYEIMRPEDVGVPETTLVLGKHSGRHAVARRCEQLGVTLSRQDLDQVYRRLVALADTQKHVTDDDLRAIVFDVSGSAPGPGAADHASESAGYGFGV